MIHAHLHETFCAATVQQQVKVDLQILYTGLDVYYLTSVK